MSYFRFRCAATASRSAGMPIPGGYWLTPAAMASWAALSIAGGPSSSGKPWPRLTAPTRAASADISANTVVAYGCSRDTVMDDELKRARVCGQLHARRGVCGQLHIRAIEAPNQQVGRALC